MSSGGGGQTAAAIDPDLMVMYEQIMTDTLPATVLSTDLFAEINTALQANPYTSFDYPSTHITEMSDIKSQYDTLKALVLSGHSNTLDEEFSDLTDKADAKFEALIGTGWIDKEMEGIKDESKAEYINAINAITAQAVDINAVNSSAFMMALSNVEQKRMRALILARTRLLAEAQKQKAAYLSTAVQEMITIINQTWDYNKAMTLLRVDVASKKIISYREKAEAELEIDLLSTKWGLSVMNSALQGISAIGGGSAYNEKPSKGMTALSTALSGASIGGAVGGPAGALIGAGIGGLGGYFAG